MKLNEGIKHIEDLPIEKFIETVRNLNAYTATEKVDGQNIKFGIDEDGFYTMSKSGLKRRQVSDYGNQFRYTPFKSAHKALATVLPDMLRLNYISVGDEIEAEILFGDLPNTVPYEGDTNKIIVIRKTNGDPAVKLIKDLFDRRNVKVSINAPVTRDGRTIDFEVQDHIWTFTNTPRVKNMVVKSVTNDVKLQGKLNNLEAYLRQDSGMYEYSNAELLALPLNKKPERVGSSLWKDIKTEIKARKQVIHDHVMSFKLDIKEDLLDTMVRQIQSEFGPDVEEGGWIEGVVLSSDEAEEELVKLVDKNVFTTLNRFNWHVRDQLQANAHGVANVKSITAKIKVKMATAIGHPELGTIQKKRYKQKHELDAEKVAKEISYGKVKERFFNILTQAEDLLQRYHIWYERYKDNAEHHVNFGAFRRKYAISPAIDEKNLQAFAELWQIIDIMKHKVENAKTSLDLVQLVLDEDVNTIQKSED